MAPPTSLHPTVRAAGAVSFLTDLSSEMIYPLLGHFITVTLGAGPIALGLVEGVADATASLVRLASGWWSDRFGSYRPLILFGYGLSTLSRPLVALATAAWHVVALRFLDRVGKGIRGAPRDALIARVTGPADRGRAFGFHRAMDHAGAVLGPLVASALIAAGAAERTVFGLALVPGLVCVAIIVAFVHDPEASPSAETAPGAPSVAGPRDPDETHAQPLPETLKRYLMAATLFGLGASSDAFLLLRAQEMGVALVHVPLLWSFHHVVKSLGSTPAGAWSDRVGRRRAIAAGWFVYALVYLGFAIGGSAAWAWALFAVYGIHHALTEGAESALVADLVGAGVRGQAYGALHLAKGAVALPASLLIGWLWSSAGAPVALATGAGLALAALLVLFALFPAQLAGAEPEEDRARSTLRP